MATAVEISRQDMNTFLAAQGFQEINIPGTKERVYSKFVTKTVCLRVYTSIGGESSRDTGEDAIRTVLVTKVNDVVKIIGGDKRVHRVEGWRNNLQNRLDRWQEQLGPACPKCQSPTIRRRSRKGPFWGCCQYPNCNSVQPISEPTRQPPVVQSRQSQADEAWRDRMREKAAFATLERKQEAKAYFDEMRAELEANGIYDGDDEPLQKLALVGDRPPSEW